MKKINKEIVPIKHDPNGDDDVYNQPNSQQ